jgi:hypothetical protein
MPLYLPPKYRASGLNHREIENIPEAFENNGMEIYETVGQVQVPLEDERGPGKVRVESCCVCWQWMSTASMRLVIRERNVPEEEMRFVVEDWMQQVRQTMLPLINVRPDEIVNRHRRP